MTEQEYSRPFQVLVVDDDAGMTKNLQDVFERFSSGQLALPAGIDTPQGMKFEVTICPNEASFTLPLTPRAPPC